jgi:hypothetical protein
MNTPVKLAGFGLALVTVFGAAVGVGSAGTYRLFLDVKHGDTVRTASFTVEAGTHEESHR